MRACAGGPSGIDQDPDLRCLPSVNTSTLMFYSTEIYFCDPDARAGASVCREQFKGPIREQRSEDQPCRQRKKKNAVCVKGLRAN